MGIYDRDYYRREGPSFLGTISPQYRVCWGLLVVNCVCFVLQMATRDGSFPFTESLELDVGKVLHGEVWRLLTYAFLHDPMSVMHIGFNMLFLIMFGRQVEEHLGSREFLAFYLVSAVVAGVAYTAAHIARIHSGVAVGASGAVTAVLVLAAFYNPRQKLLLFFVLPIPIWGFVVFMVAKDAFDLLGKSNNGVAVAAHLGGAAFGFVYYNLHWRLTDWLSSFSSLRRPRAKPRLRLYREEDELPAPAPVAAHRPAASAAQADEQLVAQMDAILEKIPRVGMEGLTEHERELLLRASEAIKRRRG
jgi:membrane associated rhomboid family serine protease